MKSNTVVPFKSKGRKLINKDGTVIDHGKIGTLKYEVYQRGVIHIFDKNRKFKKAMDVFEDEINELDFDNLKDGKSIVLKGSGDNDHLIFTRKNGDLDITLKKRMFNTLEKLKDILSSGRSKKEVI